MARAPLGTGIERQVVWAPWAGAPACPSGVPSSCRQSSLASIVSAQAFGPPRRAGDPPRCVIHFVAFRPFPRDRLRPNRPHPIRHAGSVEAAAGHHRKGSGRSERRRPLALMFFVCSYAPMSYLGRIDRDIVIPPGPTQISMAGRAWAVPPMPGGASSRPVQEACSVGFVALSSARAAAEAAFLASRSGADGPPRRGGPTTSSGTR
jgi:hypothetical protein